MNKYVRYTLITLFHIILVYEILRSDDKGSLARIVLVTSFLMMLYYLPSQIQNKELRYYSKSIIGESADFAYQLFNLRPSLSNGRAGYVYVLKSDKGFYKIGRASEPQNRLKTFNVRLPMHVNYEVLIKTPDMNRLEAHFHLQYQHKREGGEWFNLSSRDLYWLKCFPGALTDDELAKFNTRKDIP